MRISFDLDDKLNVTNVVQMAATIEYFGDPMSCQSDEVGFVRTSDDFLTVTLDSGAYNAETELFDLALDWSVPTAIGYTYTLVGNDGTRFPGQTLDAGPVVQIPGLTLSLEEGKTTFHLFTPNFGEANVEVDFEHTGSCP